MDDVFSFGVWLRRRRKTLDLTQSELANRVGCSESMIRKMEADVLRPSREMANRLATCLQLSDHDRTIFIRVARAESAVDRLSTPAQDIDTSALTSRQNPSSNLPFQLTSFIGRLSEQVHLAQLITRHRLVTISGVGGSGKTRIALEVARKEVARFPDGVLTCPL